MFPKLSIIIPLHNEQGNIQFLLESFGNYENYNFELILIDDGSTDDTKIILEKLSGKYNFDYISYNQNKGYGGAILTGLDKASGEVLSWMHSDLQTDTKYIFDAYELYLKNNDKNILVKGKRKNRRLSQIIFSNTMSFISSIVFMYKLFEINAQPKLFSRDLYTKFENPPIDFSLDLYLIVLAKNKGYKIKSIDVNFKDRVYGESKWSFNFKSKLKTIFRTLKYIIKLRLGLK